MKDSQPSSNSSETTPKSEDMNAKSYPGSTTEQPFPSPDHEPSALGGNRSPTEQFLCFLSNSSNETLLAALAGLLAATYFVLGRLGLLLIGIVVGVLLHASLEDSNASRQTKGFAINDGPRRKALAIEVAKRVLDWRDARVSHDAKEAGNATADDKAGSLVSLSRDYSSFQPATACALTDLTDAVIRDYVKWWYNPILPSEQAFPLSCRQVLVDFIVSLSTHLSRKRPADTFLHFVTNSSSVIIVFLNELSMALASPSSTLLPPAEAVQKYLDENPESNLSNALSLKQQQKKFGLVADDILHTFLDSRAYTFEPSKIFLREIFAGIVLELTVKNCSRPEWINGWIIYLLEEGEPELMNVIDAGVDGARKGEIAKISSRVSTPDGNEPTELADETIGKNMEDTEKHKRRLTQAEEAMEGAMMEAKRLSEMIAAEDARKSLDASKVAPDGTAEVTVPPASITSAEGGPGPGPVDTYSLDNQRPSSRQVSSFTTFDQIAPFQPPTALQSQTSQQSVLAPVPPPVVPLTLHDASVSIFDDSTPGEKGKLRSKPTSEYLIQIEPTSSRYPGWMIGRKYADFEKLHEVLRRISVVSGVSGFTEEHGTLPTWKAQTRQELTQSLERYLQHALKYEPLAETEGLKRFLEKEQGSISSNGSGKTGFAFPSPAAFEKMGKGVVDVLSSAPKGVAGGGKAMFEGMTGVFGGGSLNNRKSMSMGSGSTKSHARDEIDSKSPDALVGRKSHDSIASGSEISIATRPSLVRPSSEVSSGGRSGAVASSPLASEFGTHGADLAANSQSDDNTRQSSKESSSPAKPWRESTDMKLPPPPSVISDDYAGFAAPPVAASPGLERAESAPAAVSRGSTDSILLATDADVKTAVGIPQRVPLSEDETSMTVELIFAVINELYTLSSAWNIRKTLLNAAKSFLLRPGNPNLEAIRVLLQDSIIDANISDDAWAAHLRKIRENALPTEEESRLWPPEPSDEDKENLRVKARKLLIERGMPQALTSVMGAAASGEALGKVFDCLQIEPVARGLIFALLQQALRATTQ